MNWKRVLSLMTLFIFAPLLAGQKQAPIVQAEPAIFASAVHAGCYLARIDRCKIHVDPFTINIAPGTKLVEFQLVAIRSGIGTQTVIYNWRPDQSNPVPFSGSTYSPSPVAKDFGATCGASYTLSLQGRNTGEASLLNLGLTNQFTCPKGTFLDFIPLLNH